MPVEEWKKFHYDRIAEEYSYRITTAINDELKRKTHPPFTITIMLNRVLNQFERVSLDTRIRRILRGAGWTISSIMYHEDICRIVFDVDSAESGMEAMTA